jgi:hypothetical protein
MLTDYRVGYPAIPLPYGSLEYWLPGITARLLGVHEGLGALRVGRAFSLVALLAICLLLPQLARHNCTYRYAWLAVLPLFWCAYPLRWATQFAPDFPALALSLGGWLLYRPAIEERPHPAARAALQALLWTTAFHVKLTMIPGLIAYCCESLAWVLAQPQPTRRSAILRAITPLFLLVSLVVSSCFLANLFTNGGWFLNAVKSSAIFEYGLNNLWSALRFRPALLPLLSLILIFSMVTARDSWLSPAILLTAAFEMLCMTKQGSNVDYMLGTIALFGLTLPGAARNFLASTGRAPALASTSGALVLAAALAIGARDTIVPAKEFPLTSDAEINRVRAAAAKYGASRVLCMDAFTAQRTGAFYPYAEPHHTARLLQLKLFSLQPVIDRVTRHDYALIVTNQFFINPPSYNGLVLFPAQLRDAIQANYELDSCDQSLCFCIPAVTAAYPRSPARRP